MGRPKALNVARQLIKPRISQHPECHAKESDQHLRVGRRSHCNLFFFFKQEIRMSWRKPMLWAVRGENGGGAGNPDPSVLQGPTAQLFRALTRLPDPCAVVSACPLGKHCTPWFMEFWALGPSSLPSPINCSLSRADLVPVLYFLDHKVVLRVT